MKWILNAMCRSCQCRLRRLFWLNLNKRLTSTWYSGGNATIECDPKISPQLNITWIHVPACHKSNSGVFLHAKSDWHNNGLFFHWQKRWPAIMSRFPPLLLSRRQEVRAAHVITQRHQVSLNGFITTVKRNPFVYPHGNNVSHSVTVTNEQHRAPHIPASAAFPHSIAGNFHTNAD